MKIWIVEAGWDYDSQWIEEVFDSEEKAQQYVKAAEDLKKDPYHSRKFDWIDYSEKEVL